MARQTRLRVATAADAAAAAAPPAPPPPKTLVEAAQAGDDLAELRAMRVVCAEAMARPNISGRDLAALSRRQIELGREIRALEALAKQEADGDDAPAADEAFDPAAV